MFATLKKWLKTPSRKPAKTRSRQTRLQVEGLGDREMPASLVGGLLTVEGTIHDDTIRVSQNGSTIWVETSYDAGGIGATSAESFPASAVSKIKILGYEGKDFIDASGVNIEEEIRGGPQNDTIYGGRKGDTIYGQGENDLIYGNEGNDYLNGGDGNDKLYGYTGDDRLYGEAGDDYLKGNAGRDSLYGYIGRDTLVGVFGEDKYLKGNADNDSLHMTFNLDTFYKYKGYDSFSEGISGVDTFYVTMDLGSIGKSMIGRFVEQTKQFTSNLQPIADLLNTTLPLPGGNSTPSLGEILGGDYQDIGNLISTINQFDVDAFKAGSFNLGTFTVDSAWNVTQTASGSLGSQPFSSQLARLDDYIDVSFLTSANKAFKVALNFDNIELFRLNLSSYSISSGRIEQYLGTYPIGPVPVSLNLVGSLNLNLGGSIVYDLTGLRENNLIRGLRLDDAFAELSVPIAIEASVGASAVGLDFGVGGGGEVTGVITVSTGDVRLGSGGSVLGNLSVDTGVYYRLYLFATYPETYYNSPWDFGVRMEREERNVFDGWL